MNLKEYFESTGIQKSWFARKIGMKKPSYLYQICSGYKPIPKKYWKKIIELTEGKISLQDLLDQSEVSTTESIDNNDCMKTKVNNS